MTLLSTDISQELLTYLGLPELNPEKIRFLGTPIAHNLSFPIDEMIASIHGVCGLLVDEIWKIHHREEQEISVDMLHAHLSLSSVLFLRQNGYPLYPWDPKYPTLGLYMTRDNREIFLHGGYPGLRDKILKVLEAPNEAEYLIAAVRKWDALDLEEAIAEANSCATVVRTKDEWLKHQQGDILNQHPPVWIRKLCDTPAEPLRAGERPLSGLKVLDLTHVIASPACGRVMAEYGADVLHVSAPHLSQIPLFVMDTNHGKRQAFADLRDEKDLSNFKKLLAEADIFVEGWRSNKMSQFGLSPQEVQSIRPGIIHITFSCFGDEGPWHTRAGWEQLGQAASGIIDSNVIELSGQSAGIKFHLDTVQTHGMFICDYTSANLGALSVLAALIRRHREGGGYHINMALTRCGMWAISKSTPEYEDRMPLKLPLQRPEYERFLATSRNGPYGTIEYLSPVVQLSRTPPKLILPSAPLGSGNLEWLG